MTVTFSLYYDRDNQYLTYTLYRGSVAVLSRELSSGVWHTRDKASLTDKAGHKGDSYHLVVTDSSGNHKSGSTVKAK